VGNYVIVWSLVVQKGDIGDCHGSDYGLCGCVVVPSFRRYPEDGGCRFLCLLEYMTSLS
jgi:hypothetical protein